MAECYACGKKIQNGYLCKEHAFELRSMLENNDSVIEHPDHRYHCIICGEYEDRKIVYYKGLIFICDKDIEEEFTNYSSSEIDT